MNGKVFMCQGILCSSALWIKSPLSLCLHRGVIGAVRTAVFDNLR
jgi:hypothetical protein